MIAMGPKIWVEYIGQKTVPAFSRGSVYFVEDMLCFGNSFCNCHGMQVEGFGVSLRGVPDPEVTSRRWCARLFQPVYRPDKTAEEWLRTGTPAPISKDDMIRAQAAFNLQRMGR